MRAPLRSSDRLQHKWLYLLQSGGPDHQAFGRLVLDDLAPRLLALAPQQLKVTLTMAEPPRLSLFPWVRGRPTGLLSIWSAEPSPARFTEALAGAGVLAGYRVDESVPRDYPRSWPDGAPTPGVVLLTALSRRRGLDDETFFRRWYGGHTPLSLRIHPLWGYVRNAVEEAVVGGSPPRDGIVEEHFARRADLLDPRRFYGGAWCALPRMVRVAWDIAGFLDLRHIECFLMQERWLRSVPRRPPPA